MFNREYFRVPDLASKWGCTVDDIVHLGVQDKVQICASFSGVRIDVVRALDPAPIEIRNSDTDDEKEQNRKYNENLLSWLDRCSSRMPDAIMEIQHDDLLALEKGRGAPVMVETAVQYKTRWEQIEFISPTPVAVTDLVILANEVDWVGGRFFGPTRGGITSDETVLDDSTDEGANSSLKPISGKNRNERIIERWQKWNSKGVKDPTARVAKEFNLSDARIRQIRQKNKKPIVEEIEKTRVSRGPATPFDGL